MKLLGLLPYSLGHSAQCLGQEAKPYEKSLKRRLKQAPPGGYLAIDLLVVKHTGEYVQGLGPAWSSSDKGVVWSHTFVSVGLVYPKERFVYPLGLLPFLDKTMATEVYRHQTPSEAFLKVAKQVGKHYSIEALLGDGQFITDEVLAKAQSNLVGRCRVGHYVDFEGEHIQVKALAQRYPPTKKARYYKRFGWYAKRLNVTIPSANHKASDLIIIWKPRAEGFELLTLFSTLDAGVQEVLAAWKSRWKQEVGHKLNKQTLGLSKCQCRSYASQLKHADLVIEAFHQVRLTSTLNPSLSWREARKSTAFSLKNPTQPLQNPVQTGIPPPLP